MPTLKQDLIDRIILDAAKHSAAVEAAAADLETVEALAARLHATGSGRSTIGGHRHSAHGLRQHRSPQLLGSSPPRKRSRHWPRAGLEPPLPNRLVPAMPMTTARLSIWPATFQAIVQNPVPVLKAA